MSRDSKSQLSSLRAQASVDARVSGEVTLVTVAGLVDERFLGFGDLGAGKIVVLDVSKLTRMTSFGVRQWLKAIDALPKTIAELYLLGCPTFFVDQLNMVLNFGGTAKILTVAAPYTCPACGVESGETIDVLAERANLAKGGLPEKDCSRCGGRLEFDETPESYFAFVAKYAASSIVPAAAQVLAAHDLYTSPDSATEKPPRIIKLVHGSVTYFRIIGTIGSMFRARPFLVGAEGEVVIDLAEVDRFDPAGQKEWRRLLKNLSTQVPAVTLVDVTESFLTNAGETMALARNIAVASVLVPYVCMECGRTAHVSEPLLAAEWPRHFDDRVCTTCGGTTRDRLAAETLVPLHKASTSAPHASVKVFEQRFEILSRALTDANVAQAGESATAAIGADDTILGKYKIVRRLSAGGMAEVFLAKQVGIGGFERPVALKRIQRKLLETRHQAIELFLNEAKIAGRLTHPNIVQVLDVGEVGGALYLAMDYVHGRDLRRVIRKLQSQNATMPLGEVCHVIREVALALDHAYWSTDMAGKQLAVVHRDVSPHNIILGYDGTVKLLDFGVAMSAVTEHAETMIVGKWSYMSPETTTNAHIDHRSDLFSLGVIFYLLCSGAMPFAGTEPKKIVRKIRAGEYKRLTEIAPRVPPPLEALVDRMLAPQPRDRPQRGQEVVAGLSDIMRRFDLEGSGPSVARFLAELMPDEATETEHPTGEMVRVVREDPSFRDRSPRETASPISITPTSTSSRNLQVDVSETYRPSRIRQIIQSDSQPVAPVFPQTPTPPPAARTVSRPPAQPAPSRTKVWILVLLLGALAAAVYHALGYALG